MIAACSFSPALLSDTIVCNDDDSSITMWVNVPEQKFSFSYILNGSNFTGDFEDYIDKFSPKTMSLLHGELAGGDTYYDLIAGGYNQEGTFIGLNIKLLDRDGEYSLNQKPVKAGAKCTVTRLPPDAMAIKWPPIDPLKR